jgi:hypothetical protein
MLRLPRCLLAISSKHYSTQIVSRADSCSSRSLREKLSENMSAINQRHDDTLAWCGAEIR